MGLDMFLEGEEYYWQSDRTERIDGFPVKSKVVELAYWRKHPDLHGYIVKTFADGKDECQEIPLDGDRLKLTLAAVTERKLPHTEGFFFGTSREEDRTYTILALKAAMEWAAKVENGKSRYIRYRASW